MEFRRVLFRSDYDVSLGTAQWGLTAALLAGAVVTPGLGRLADVRYRRQVILAALGTITAGGASAALPLGCAALLAGRTRLLGRALPPAITSPRASVAPARPARATRRYGRRCVRPRGPLRMARTPTSPPSTDGSSASSEPGARPKPCSRWRTP